MATTNIRWNRDWFFAKAYSDNSLYTKQLKKMKQIWEQKEVLGEYNPLAKLAILEECKIHKWY
jgi:hypothetical protein